MSLVRSLMLLPIPTVLFAQSTAVLLAPWPAGAPVERCTPARGDAHQLVEAAWHAAGVDRMAGRVAHYKATDYVQLNFESDRPYPPFVSVVVPRDEWFDPTTGIEWSSSPNARPGAPVIVDNGNATFLIRDTVITPELALTSQANASRPLNVWAVLSDWRSASDAHVVARCIYRDYPRDVLQRKGKQGMERLYLDVKTGLPVALVRTEPHYLWGQQRVDYVYATWWATSEPGILRPLAVARVTDGATEIDRIDQGWQLSARDSFPLRAALPEHAPMPVVTDAFLAATVVDTEHVSATIRTLRDPGYREAITSVHDTVYVMDATQGEARARLDSAWIARLYPHHRAVVVIVTDLAWPHIAGVRFWVARGATIVSHRVSRDFIERIVAHRWTDSPDVLESARRVGRAPKLHFVPVDDSLQLAGGGIRLFAIDGIASEGALMVYVPGDRVLWASDYFQDPQQPAEYTREVWLAARRHGLAPLVVVAEHVAPTPWGDMERLASP